MSPPDRRAPALFRLLFPDPPREFRGRRSLKITLRAVHVLCAALLVGALAFDAAEPVRDRWLHAAIASGAALLALDVHESCAFLLQTRGVFVLGKIVAVLSLPRLGNAAALVLGGLLLASVWLSHAPASIRYRTLWLADRVRGSKTPG